ncbi:hypothetical protein [Azospirillum agricola]|uniref:hypothetical protein n=1 Tax=Azospirillum agricola TaxID=1720247 RepID=UPI001177F507|nr:hypothetical protein [Azospirillum agricola]
MAMTDGGSPWAGYTGAQDGAATALPWALSASPGGSARSSYGAVLLTPTKGVVAWPNTNRGDNYWGTMSFCVFSLNGNTIAWGAKQDFAVFAGTGYGIAGPNGQEIAMKRVSDTQAVAYYSSDRNANNAFVFSLDGADTITLGTVNKADTFGVSGFADRLQNLTPATWVDNGTTHTVSGTSIAGTVSLASPVPYGFRGCAVLDSTHVCVGVTDASSNLTYKIYSISGTTWTEIRNFSPPYAGSNSIVYGRGQIRECGIFSFASNGYMTGWGKLTFAAGTYVPTFTAYTSNPPTNTWWYQNPDALTPDGKAGLFYRVSGSNLSVAAQTFDTGSAVMTPPVTATTSLPTNSAVSIDAFPASLPSKAVLSWNNGTALYLKILVAA